jgi:hypothetical protein
MAVKALKNPMSTHANVFVVLGRCTVSELPQTILQCEWVGQKMNSFYIRLLLHRNCKLLLDGGRFLQQLQLVLV